MTTIENKEMTTTYIISEIINKIIEQIVYNDIDYKADLKEVFDEQMRQVHQDMFDYYDDNYFGLDKTDWQKQIEFEEMLIADVDAKSNES